MKVEERWSLGLKLLCLLARGNWEESSAVLGGSVQREIVPVPCNWHRLFEITNHFSSPSPLNSCLYSCRLNFTTYRMTGFLRTLGEDQLEKRQQIQKMVGQGLGWGASWGLFLALSL